MSPSRKRIRRVARTEKLTKRTVQIIGFGTAFFLIGFKLYSKDADIPWWAIFGFFSFGASADVSFLKDWMGRK